ncbi:MAG TPA: hypothetical protein VJZ76_12820 [Thermoanaerobaculia bacterium]|nr:hypothetical protein [Thermoanaerobaculia bacterium]
MGDDIRDQWQNQNGEAFRMSADEIRQRIEEVNANVYGRNRIIHRMGPIMGFLTILLGIWLLIEGRDPLARVGWALLLGSFALGFYRGAAFRRATKTAVQRAEEMGDVGSVEFFKGQLERLRDFHSGARYWPSLLLCVAGVTLAGHQSRNFVIATIALTSVIAPLIFRMTRQYQHQLDEINRLQDL